MQNNFENGPLIIDFSGNSVYMMGQAIHLTPYEFQLLEILSQHVGKVLTYQVLLKALFDTSISVTCHHTSTYGLTAEEA